jgi:8-oxo-dGTP diphosphatase
VTSGSSDPGLQGSEVYYEAVLVGGLDGLALDPKEVFEARLFSPGNLPDGMPEAHRDLAASL